MAMVQGRVTSVSPPTSLYTACLSTEPFDRLLQSVRSESPQGKLFRPTPRYRTASKITGLTSYVWPQTVLLKTFFVYLEKYFNFDYSEGRKSIRLADIL